MLCVCLSVCHVSPGPLEARRGCWILGTDSLGCWLWSACDCWELNSDLPEEEEACLTAELSLQFLYLIFWDKTSFSLWSRSSWTSLGCPGSSSDWPSSTPPGLGLQAHTTAFNFLYGNWEYQVPMLAWQALYQLRNIPAPYFPSHL